MSSFLRQLHACFTTHPDEVAAVVRRVTSVPIARHEKLIRGYDNEVHLVVTEDGTRLVVRIRRRGEVSASDEAWAIERARQRHAPVPEVLQSERLWIDGAEREVMVQRALVGRPLDDVAATLGKEQLRVCILQAGAALATIHSVAVEGFYRRHDGIWDFPTWESIADSNVRDRTSERAAVLSVGLGDAEFETLIGTLDWLQHSFTWERPVLLHGDFTPAHLFFDDALSLTGIVDFGDFQGGSPIVDVDELLANAVGWGLDDEECVEWLRTGYGPSSIWEHFAERRVMQAIGYAIGSINYHASIDDPAAGARYAARLRKLLTWIQSNPQTAPGISGD